SNPPVSLAPARSPIASGGGSFLCRKGRAETSGELREDGGTLVERELGAGFDALVQADAVQELHHDERLALRRRAHIEDAHDIGTRELRHGARLLVEARLCRRVVDRTQEPS